MSLPVLVMNTTILVEDGLFRLHQISLEEAKAIVSSNEILSGIGHESTAEIITDLLGVQVPMNRINCGQAPGQIALCFKLNSRPKEGAILDKATIEEIGYSFKLLERLE